jgi:hypothetical protein
MDEQLRVAVITGAANGPSREFAMALAGRPPGGRPRHRRRERHGGRAVAGRSVPVTEEPGNLVSTPLYVCDEGSSFLTGQAIVVDGGSAKH